MNVGWGHIFMGACGAVLASTAVFTAPGGGQAPTPATPAAVVNPAPPAPERAFLESYCITCHNEQANTAGLALDTFDVTNLTAHTAEWEKVVVKLRAGLMPPAGMPRPPQADIDAFAASLENALDYAAAVNPNPGRTEPFHRLNRAEYRNAVRDLLGLDIDMSTMLPQDEVSYGFDNIAGVLKLSPLLTDRYLVTAQKVARLAVGTPGPPNGDYFRVPDQLDQDIRLEGMPLGTRGGHRVEYFAPRDGEYDIKVRIGRGLDYDVPHYLGDNDLEISVDGIRMHVFTLPETPGWRLNIERQIYAGPNAPGGGAGGDRPDANADFTDEMQLARRDIDDDWVVRVPLKAGYREIRATFIAKTNAVSEGFREPFLKPYIGRGVNDVRETREGAALREMEIMGPVNAGSAEGSPTHQRIFSCHPASPVEADELACAEEILTPLARRAYRRPVAEGDLDVLLDFYREGRATGDFHTGIELAIQRMLVSPSFLFRTEFDPADKAVGNVYQVSDLSLASRLSFFLWSSIPDDELLDLAIAGRLREPGVLEAQVDRLLADPRSEAFILNFVGQWLNLRALPDIVPDPFLFPDYGDTLARAFRTETEMFFDAIVREDRPAMDLLTADFTFVNERLARHYGIPNVAGINFRRVTLPADSPRRGLLGKGSILTVTAYPNRTSPVIRGKWVLQNILGAPPPEPPPNVPQLQENGEAVTNVQTLRARLEAHRANPVCASCHKLMDPIGFALESFDAVGRFRTYDENFVPIDNTGIYADGTEIAGPSGLREVLVARGDQFLVNLTSKLLTYALGRGVEPYDMPAVRAILDGAEPSDYRFSSLVRGIVESAPFQMRRSES